MENLSENVTYQIVFVCFVCCSVVAGVILWAYAKFQTKIEAINLERSLRIHISKVEDDVKMMKGELSKIGADVSYIRGRLEPKLTI